MDEGIKGPCKPQVHHDGGDVVSNFLGIMVTTGQEALAIAWSHTVVLCQTFRNVDKQELANWDIQKACQVVKHVRKKFRNTIYERKLMSRYTEVDTLSESFIHRSQLSFMSLSTACKAGSLASPVWQKLTPKKMTCGLFLLEIQPSHLTKAHLIQHAKMIV